MSEQGPRYRVWRQSFDDGGVNEPTAGAWLTRTQARMLRDATFRQTDVARTWIEKEGVPAEFVGETPFIIGEPVSAAPDQTAPMEPSL